MLGCLKMRPHGSDTLCACCALARALVRPALRQAAGGAAGARGRDSPQAKAKLAAVRARIAELTERLGAELRPSATP